MSTGRRIAATSVGEAHGDALREEQPWAPMAAGGKEPPILPPKRIRLCYR